MRTSCALLILGLLLACTKPAANGTAPGPTGTVAPDESALITLDGWLLDEAARPCAGATLEILTTAKTFPVGFPSPLRRAAACTTTAEGRFETHVPSDTVAVRVGYREGDNLWFPWEWIPARELDGALGALRLPPLRVVAGHLLDAEGRAAAGAELCITEEDQLLAAAPEGFLMSEYDDFGWTLESTGPAAVDAGAAILNTETDAAGAFRFEGRFRNPVVTFTDAEGVPHARNCGSPVAWSSLTLRACPLHDTEFLFTREGMSPAVGAQAAVPVSRCWGDYVLLRPTKVQAASGVVRYRTEAPGILTAALRMEASHPWFARSDLYREDVPASMELPAPRTLEVHVLGADDELVSDAVVGIPGPDSLFAFPFPGAPPSLFRAWQKTSPGVYRMTPAAIPDMAAVIIEAPGKAPGFWVWEILDESAARVMPDWNEAGFAVLHDARALEVTILSEGAPFAGAWVQAGPIRNWSGDEPPCPEHSEIHEFLPRFGRTGTDGLWQAGELCALGEIIGIRVGASVQDAAWDGISSALVVDVGPVGNVAGTIQFQGQPVPFALLEFESEDQETCSILTDGQGRFATPALPGTYVLTVRTAQAGPHGPLVYACGVSLLPGEDVTRDLDLAANWSFPTATVHGELRFDELPWEGWVHFTCAPVGEDASTLPHLNFTHFQALRAHAASDQAEEQFPLSFSVPVRSGVLPEVEIPAGAVVARLLGAADDIFEQRPPLFEGVLAEGQALDLSRNVARATLHIEVVDAAGGPLPGARVTVRRESPGDGELQLTTGLDGTCAVPLAPGPYQVAAYGGDHQYFPPVTRPLTWNSARRAESRIDLRSGEAATVRLSWTD